MLAIYSMTSWASSPAKFFVVNKNTDHNLSTNSVDGGNWNYLALSGVHVLRHHATSVHFFFKDVHGM